ncbi:hypothetical protein [Prevotella communis]|uniref:hypothetical protein n=1 Tax=Prevotella communis TaxID=2913614 RepID=UPI001EDBE187|nr:hypothetical protein [Prevotella communis]UKK56284.1 hypothetical protein L6476_12645 [Prevotella communis]
MRLITKLWATLLLLCVAGVASAATEYEVDQRFTSISDLDGKSFAIVDETPTTPTAMGIGITGHGQGWDMYFGTITEAYNSNACFYKLEAVTTEGLEGYYYLRTYKADGNMYTAWGNTTTMGYFNSQLADKSCCFALGLEGRNGQDGTNLAIWAIEESEGKFALKNIGTGLYLHADNLPAKYEDAFYFTFCSLKEKAQTDPLASEKDDLSTAIAKGKMIKALAYTDATFGALTTAITDGETALASTEATATSLTNATNAITNAIEALALKAGFTSLQDVDFGVFNGWGAEATLTQKVAPTWDLFKATGQSYGDPSVNNRADVSAFDKLYVVAVSGSPRILMNRDADNGQWNETEAESHLIDNTKGGWSAKYFSTEDGITTVDLKQLVADKGFAHLTAIKSYDNNVISGLYLYKEATVANEDVLPIDIQFGESYNDKKVQNYTSTWTATKDGKTWTIVNFNNNNSGWDLIKCGSKNDASVATITSPAINAVVKSYIISLTKASNINSAKLTIMNGEEKVGEDIDITEQFVAGDVVVPVESQKGYSYVLTIDNKQASGNGSVEISKITLSGEAIQPVEPVHIENTAETAYTVAKAIELIDAGEALSETVFVKGIVSKVDEYNEQYKNISYWISDDGTTESAQFECFRGKGIDGADFTSIDDIKVGATVIVKGTMKKFVKEGQADIYEFNQNNELVSYEAPVAPAELFAGETGKYYIFNTAAEKYLGAGNSWGTQASLLKNPDFVTLIKQPDGTYQLESQVSNGDNKYFFNGSFMDSNAPVNLTITKIPEAFGYKDEQETEPVYAYTIATGEKFYGWDGTTTVLASNLTADNENAAWLIFTESEILDGLKEATAENPVDATFLITDHTFGRNHRNVSAWTNEGGAALTGGNSDKHDAEKFHGAFNVYQKLTKAPAGIYKFTAQGFYRQDGTDEENLPVFYANDVTSLFPVKTGAENSMADACTSFEAGLYAAEPIYVQVTEDGELTVGAKLETNASLWCIWDNFELFYYGNEATLEQVKNAAIIAELDELRTNASEKIEDAEVEAVKTALQDALTATAEVDKSDAEAIKTAIATLKAAVEKAEASLEAKAKLAKMKELIDATNVYTAEAKNAYYDQWVVKYNDGTITKTEANALQDPFLVTGWHANVTVDNFLLSAWDTNPDFQDAAYYINTWSNEGETDGSNFKVPFFEYWTNDDKSLAEKTLTATMNGLEAGNYDVTAWVRVRAKNGYEAPVTGITMQANDGEAVDVAAGDQVGESQFYMKEFTATGTVAEDGILKIKFNVAADNNISWLSFKNVKFGEHQITPEEIAALELEAAKADLQTAITAAKAIETEGKNGADALATAITDAETALNAADATVETIATAKANLADAIILFDKANLDANLIEIAQEQQDQEGGVVTLATSEKNEKTGVITYTSKDQVSVIFKMKNVDVSNCDYILFKFTEPTPAGLSYAFWTNNKNKELPAGITEFKYVFAEDNESEIKDGIIPEISLLTIFTGAGKVVKVAGVYKHQVPVEVTHTWDFTKWSEATVANLKAEAAKVTVSADPDKEGNTKCEDNGALWSDHEKKPGTTCDTYAASKDNCFWYVGGEATPTANGTAIAEFAGLQFNTAYGASRALAIAVNYPSTSIGTYNGPSYLWFGGKGQTIMTIPAVKGGSTIKIGVESHKSSEARGIQLFAGETELKDAEGNAVAAPKTYTEQTWVVPAGVAYDIVVKNTNGCHIYFIDAEQDENTLTSINTVKSNVMNNAIYNLNGQKVNKAQKGLFIINGKKVVK